jgi:hypothetical protein
VSGAVTRSRLLTAKMMVLVSNVAQRGLWRDARDISRRSANLAAPPRKTCQAENAVA